MKKNISKITISVLAGAVVVTGLTVFTTTVNAAAKNLTTNSQVQSKTRSHIPHLGIGGNVTAINGTTISVTSNSKKNPVVYTIDASNTKIFGENARTVSDIKIGDNITVIGSKQDTTVIASMIIDHPKQTEHSKTTAGIKNQNGLSPSPKN